MELANMSFMPLNKTFFNAYITQMLSYHLI